MEDKVEVVAEIDELEKARLSAIEKEKRLTDVEDNIDEIVQVIATIEGGSL